MSPIPCFVDSCSNVLSVDPTGALVVETRLASGGSILCDDEVGAAGGLYVQVFGVFENEFSPEAVPCGQSLRRAASGELFAMPEGAWGLSQSELGIIDSGNGTNLMHIDTEGGTAGAGPSGGAAAFKVYPGTGPALPQFSGTKTIINPFDCVAYCRYVVHEAKVLFMRSDPMTPNPITDESYYVVGDANLVVSGAGVTPHNSGAVHRFDIYGSWSGPAPAMQKSQHAFEISTMFRMNPGAVATVTHNMEVSRSYHVDMDTFVGDPDADDKGLYMAHSEALIWRQDTHPAVVDV